MTQTEVLEIFRSTGALLKGHFLLRSGLHSREFFQCALALQQMPTVERLGKDLAERCRRFRPATVVAPAMGGLVIGQEVARQLGLRFIFVEKDGARLVLRRGFTLQPGERCLVIEDVVTRGGRASETIEIVRNGGGTVVGVGMLVDRSQGLSSLDVPTESLIQLQVETFEPDKLPDDLKTTPAIKPGS